MTTRSTARNTRSQWDARAPDARFSHPLHVEPLRDGLHAGARVLEVGCGYGRQLGELAELGFAPVGCEPSAGMLERARADGVVSAVVQADGRALPFASDRFDAATLQAVLTSIPDDEDQRGLLAELQRVLVPGGLLQVSDLLLQDDERNRRRYDEHAARFGRRGVFALPDGGVFRHHERDWLAELLGAFTTVAEQSVDAMTMKGHAARAWQWTGRLGGAQA
jgi:SAM-dependent methyltransferase